MTKPNGERATRMPAPGKPWLRPLLFGTALLISGAVIGSALTVIVLRSQAERAREDPAWPSQRVAARLIRDLDLTPEQSEQVREIFQAHHERVRAFRQKHGTSAREMFVSLQSEIEQVLTPEQAEKWRQRIERARKHALRGGRGGRGERGDRGGRGDHRPRRDRMRPADGPPPPNGMPPSDGMPPPPDGQQPPERPPPPLEGPPPR